MRLRLSLAAARLFMLGAAATLPLAFAQASPPEPSGYRMDDFRSATPETLQGAAVVDNDAAYALWRTGRVVFIDVMPQPPKPSNLPAGAIWRAPKRNSIPDAIWLPNTGYGRLSPERDTYFRSALSSATKSDPTAPIVIFCQISCWMSWNAAKRAIEEYGYTRVYWYPDGTDGWDLEGHPLVPVKPEPE